MSRDHVTKYLEVRMFSLAVIALMVSVLCVFFLFLFVSRSEYLYAALIGVVAVIMVLAAIKLVQYGRMFRRSLQKDKNELKESGT